MSIPNISTRATNVELTDERRSLISRRLSPLARFLVHEDEVNIDVVMRSIRARLGGDMFYISVKVTTPNDVYVTVAQGRQLGVALTKARETLRRSICRGESIVDYELRKQRQSRDALTLTIPGSFSTT